MTILDVLLIGIGLAMDAFAVSVCKGMIMQEREWKKACVIGGWFGCFQMLMPLAGFALGSRFSGLVASVDHWIAFGMLGFIGGMMIRESFHPEEEKVTDSVSWKAMLPLAVATSIDALATGITFAFLDTNIWTSVLVIGAVTFLLSYAGVFLGRAAGEKLEKRAKLAGGIILILIGLKILIEHLSAG